MFKANIFTQLGATNHSDNQRAELDYYASDPEIIGYLLEFINRANIYLPKRVIETSVGAGHLAKELQEYGYTVEAYDIINRGWKNTIVTNFLSLTALQTNESKFFVQNPPYKQALSFVKKCLSLCNLGEYVCSFLKIQFLEGIERSEFFKTNPPKYVVVFSKRTNCARNGNFDKYESSAVCYCWFIWQKGFNGSPIISWCKR